MTITLLEIRFKVIYPYIGYGIGENVRLTFYTASA